MHLKDALNTFKNAFKMHFLNGEIKCISNYAGYAINYWNDSKYLMQFKPNNNEFSWKHIIT